jgi:hypothetical protein
VLRGAPIEAPAVERRCARRVAAEKEGATTARFRCCYGAPNAARIQEPSLDEPYREVDVPLDELRIWLKSDPHTEWLAGELAVFGADGEKTVLDRGPGDLMGFTLTTRAVEWSPAQGVRLLVVVGRSGANTAFVLAYHMAGSTRQLAGSFIMKNEGGPLALAYAPSIRPRMHFSNCWGCPGETGKLLFRPPESVVLLQP